MTESGKTGYIAHTAARSWLKMPRPTKEERTCPECGSTNTYAVGYRAGNKFIRLAYRYCLSCNELLSEPYFS